MTVTNRHRMFTNRSRASEFPETIGRGTGCTIKQFNQALNALMRRKGMPSMEWRTEHRRRWNAELQSSALEAMVVRALFTPFPFASVGSTICRLRKLDLWAML